MTVTRTTPKDQNVYSTISRSLVISAIRCLLSYVVFPFVLPSITLIRDFEPIIGIVIGLIAIGFNIRAMQQLFSTSHRYRWYFSVISTAVIVLLMVLLIGDLIALA